MDYRIEEILTKVERDISQSLRIEDLANSVNVSISHFQRLFKKELNTSPVKYIKNLRLQRAREFLETTHFRIEEIRQKIGATSEAHFTHDFKLKFGETPNNYRKKFRNDAYGEEKAQTGSK